MRAENPTSVKCSPVGISSNMSKIPALVWPLESSNFPPNLPLRAVPIPGNAPLSVSTRGANDEKSFRFGSCTIIFRTCARVIVSVLMTKEATDCGNEGIQDGRRYSRPIKVNFFTFVNHGVYLANFSRPLSSPPTERRSSLMWRMGLSSGIKPYFHRHPIEDDSVEDYH